MNASRRALASFLALAALGPKRVYAQSAPKYRVGSLWGGSALTDKMVPHMKRGMQDLGHIEGKDVAYVHRWTEGFLDRVPVLAKELIGQRVDVIVVNAVTVARAVQQTSPKTPVVMAGGFDPVYNGVADSLARPGRSVTGIVNLSDDLARKHLELVRELAPRARRIGVLSAASDASAKVIAELHSASKRFQIEIVASTARTPDDLAPAVSRLGTAGIDALLVLATPVFTTDRSKVLEHVARLRVPVVYPDSEYIDAGGLVSYGPRRADIFYGTASYVSMILKGAKPGDLPIEQPTKFELVINLKTAKAMDLAVPPAILLRADRMIE